MRLGVCFVEGFPVPVATRRGGPLSGLPTTAYRFSKAGYASCAVFRSLLCRFLTAWGSPACGTGDLLFCGYCVGRTVDKPVNKSVNNFGDKLRGKSWQARQGCQANCPVTSSALLFRIEKGRSTFHVKRCNGVGRAR